MSTDSNTIYLLIPEIVLVLVATAIYLGGAFSRARDGWTWLAMAGLLLSAVALSGQPIAAWQSSSAEPAEQTTGSLAAAVPGARAATSATAAQANSQRQFSGPLLVDMFSQSMRWLILAAGFLFVLFFWRSAAGGERPELIGSLLLIVAGLMIVALATDLVLLFAGLELVSIPTYVMLGLGRRDRESHEATAKYFFLSVLSSAVLLYGFSFLYGAAGSTSLTDIYATLFKAHPDAAGLRSIAGLGMVFVIAGLGFRITAVPFHFYAPDVYQGTSHANAALLSVAPKIAGFTALIRVVDVGMPHFETDAWQIAMAMSILTMTVGNLLALWQNNIRRMLAYSSIAHAGYMLIGFTVGLASASDDHPVDHIFDLDGVGTLLFYLVVYAVATIGAFAVLSFLSSDERQIDGVDELAGLSRTYPWMSGAMALFMLSLTGLPPLAGFWGKFALFTGALGTNADGRELGGGPWKWFVALALAGAVNAAISAAYYLRVVGVMYFRSSLTVPSARGGLGAAVAAGLCAVAVLAAGLYPGPLFDQANRASQAARASFVAGPHAKPPQAVQEQATARVE